MATLMHNERTPSWDHDLHEYQHTPSPSESPEPHQNRQKEVRGWAMSMLPEGSKVELAASGREKKYMCPWDGCPKTFTTSGHLSRHYRIHTGEKKFSCPQPGCESRFSRADNMLQHYRTHNKDAKPRRRKKAASISVMEPPAKTLPQVPEQSAVQHTESRPIPLAAPYSAAIPTVSPVLNPIRTSISYQPQLRSLLSATNPITQPLYPLEPHSAIHSAPPVFPSFTFASTSNQIHVEPPPLQPAFPEQYGTSRLPMRIPSLPLGENSNPSYASSITSGRGSISEFSEGSYEDYSFRPPEMQLSPIHRGSILNPVTPIMSNLSLSNGPAYPISQSYPAYHSHTFRTPSLSLSNNSAFHDDTPLATPQNVVGGFAAFTNPFNYQPPPPPVGRAPTNVTPPGERGRASVSHYNWNSIQPWPNNDLARPQTADSACIKASFFQPDRQQPSYRIGYGMPSFM